MIGATLEPLELDDFLTGRYPGFHSSNLRDSEGYIHCFDARDEAKLAEAKKFMDIHGFAVLRDVFTPEECEGTREAMWNQVEGSYPGLKRGDASTWGLYKSTGKYGLSSRGPTFDATLVNNRQNPVLAAALACVLNTSTDDVMVSHDRFTIYRATGLEEADYGVGSGGVDAALSPGAGAGAGAGAALATGQRNIHLDLNPWWWQEGARDILIGADSLTYSTPEDLVRENNLVACNMGPHVQCVLNFLDNREEDGGTLVVPGFHRVLAQWCEREAACGMRRKAPFVTFNQRAPLELASEQALLDLSVRVSMRAGSVLVWHQTLAHGTQPNASKVCRLAQFMKAFSRSAAFEEVGRYPQAQAQAQAQAQPQPQPLPVVEVPLPVVEVPLPPTPPTGREEEAIGESNPAPPKVMPKAKTKGPVVQKNTWNSDEKYKNWQWDGSSRLVRRALRIQSELAASGALDLVTPLGKRLFGLDALS
jgi:hypothetical protein